MVDPRVQQARDDAQLTVDRYNVFLETTTSGRYADFAAVRHARQVIDLADRVAALETALREIRDIPSEHERVTNSLARIMATVAGVALAGSGTEPAQEQPA